MGVLRGSSRLGAGSGRSSSVRDVLSPFEALPRRRRDDDAQETIRHLQRALESRVAIEQAKGILAERFQLSIDDAFNLLRDAARASRKPLQLLAQGVIDHADVTTEEIVASLARPERWQTGVSDRRSVEQGLRSAKLVVHEGIPSL